MQPRSQIRSSLRKHPIADRQRPNKARVVVNRLIGTWTPATPVLPVTHEHTHQRSGPYVSFKGTRHVKLALH